MATSEEIRQRVEKADTARSARRAAAAQRVGELARRQAEIVARLAEVERELGEVVAGAQDVIDVDELAAFTDLKPSDLTGWLAGRKPGRGRGRKAATTGARGGVPSSSGSRAPAPEQRRGPGDGSAAARTDTSEPPVARAS